MTTVVGVGLVALILAPVVGALATSAILIAYLWRWARRTDPFEPQAAEAPDLDEAFADARRIVTGRMPAADVEQLVQEHDWHAAEYMMRRV